MLEFAEDGRRIKSRRMRKGSNYDDDVVVDLASEHEGVSDLSLSVALGAVKKDKREMFRTIVGEIIEHCKNEDGERL